MSAKVIHSPWGGWIGYCAECKETIAGESGPVWMWSDAHNGDKHQTNRT